MIIPTNKEMKKVKCAICKKLVVVDEVGNGEACLICGWMQDATARDMPEQISLPNKISLQKARELYKQGKPLTSDFEDFIDFCEMYGEVEFTYKGIIYGIARTDDAFEFWACNVPVNERTPIVFGSIDDFAASAKIGNVLIKDLWGEVEDFGALK